MSNDQKKQDDKQKVKPSGAPLPGLGGKLSGAPLPGLGGKPSGAPLPGLGGKQSGSPLPGLGGLGGKSPLPGLGKSSNPLPGLGVKPKLPGLGDKKAPVPPFLQQPEPEKPAGPSPEQVARDPFGAEAMPPPSPSYAPGGLIQASADPSVQFSAAEVGKSRKPLIVGLGALLLLGLVFGYIAGTGSSTRTELNIAICDAWITEYEIKQAANILKELQSVIGAASTKAAKREYDKVHMEWITQNIKGNPIPANLFTQRNYKKFEAAAVQYLTDYYNRWNRLDTLIQLHRMKTTNDEKTLTAARGQFERLLQTLYGVVFKRDKNQNGKLIGDVVVVGGCNESRGGKVMCTVQVEPGTAGDERELFNPPPGSDKAKDLAENPSDYVMELGEHSKAGLLQNASQSHFNEYAKRLREMSELMQTMTKEQDDLLGSLANISSQEPVILSGINPEKAFEEYVANRKSAASAEGQ